MKKLNIDTWNRKEHFEFFSKFDEPFFGIVTEIDCTIAYKKAKEKGYSLFAYYLHKSLVAINSIEAFRYRIYNNDVFIHDAIDASPTIGRKDETYGFSFVKYNEDFEIFNKSLKKEISEVQNSVGLRLNDDTNKNNVVHYSSIPWNHFTALSHARNYNTQDSAPKITFGKIHTVDGTKKMSVSIHVHHALLDGLHVSKHLELFQKLMNED